MARTFSVDSSDRRAPWSACLATLEPESRPPRGTRHDLAFHNQDADACHHAESGERRECQRYTGPEPWVLVYAPPLIP